LLDDRIKQGEGEQSIVQVAEEECEGRRDFIFLIYAISPSATFLWNTTVT
jgi:hypothetical protein